MLKSILFIVLTQFFQFNELNILRQPGYFIFKLNQPIFFLQCNSDIKIFDYWLSSNCLMSEKQFNDYV